jgi:hypothetical protein
LEEEVMNMTKENFDLANKIRLYIQSSTPTIGDGESVAMIVLWSFIIEHAKAHAVDREALARSQLDSFIEFARESIVMKQVH